MDDITGIGAYGDQFLKRAFVAYMGLGANIDEDATCPRTFTDDQGNQLNGKYNYILHFDKDQLPPVEAFWSVTMYDKDFYLVQNELIDMPLRITPQGLSIMMMAHWISIFNTVSRKTINLIGCQRRKMISI
jgi:hypothetical protein